MAKMNHPWLGQPDGHYRGWPEAEVTKLAPEPGDLIVYRPVDRLTDTQAHEILDLFECALPKGVRCIILAQGGTLEHYPKDKLAELLA